MSTIALFKPFTQPETEGSAMIKSYWNARYNRANPRGETYMKQALQSFFPEADFVNVNDNENWQSRANAAQDIVLLYPDATGLEFADIEKQLPQNKNILVLNGRKRFFRKDKMTGFQIAVRRFCENFLIGEILFTIFFAILTPVFVLIDALKGRK